MQEDERIIFIDMYAAKNGVMNPRDGTQKDTCWNTIIPILNKIWSYGFQCACNWPFELCIFGVFTFPYQQALAQLDKHKASLWYFDKDSTENRNIDKLNHIGFKTALPMPYGILQ